MDRVIHDGIAYDRLILLRLGEITLKGQNRSRFVNQMMRSLRRRVKPLADVKVHQEFSRIWIQGKAEAFPIEKILKAIRPVFGYVSASPVRRVPLDLEALKAEVLDYVKPLFNEQKTFKFTVKRIDKTVPYSSYELCCLLGDLVLSAYPNTATVNVTNPDYEFFVEIREHGQAFMYHAFYPAFKGLPVGMSGRGLLLLSGGLDSPVAGFRMASRGMQLEAIYFHTFPYTSEDAKQKVLALAEILAEYAGDMMLHVVNFTPCQLALNEAVPEELMTVIMRRMMLRIADKIAEERKLGALISGESLGQVASQTLEALQRVDHLPTRPVFRPLIGMDKDEIIELAREIGTFETSILPYEDCCTVFVAKHPKTRPNEEECVAAEQGLAIEDLVLNAVKNTESLPIKL